MSHYSVAVFTDEYTNIDSLLEPFDEDIEVDKYVAMTKEDLIEQGKREINFLYRCYKQYKKDKRAYRRNCKNIAHIRIIKKALIMKKWSRERIYKFATRFYDKEDFSEDGGIYSTYNPNSKWDWYEIGGRWKNQLIIKNNDNPKKIIKRDSALIKDIDWEEMKKQNELKLMDYNEFLKQSIYKEFNKIWYPTEEIYKLKMTEFSTYAVLTPDGEWYEPGIVGWWGISSASTEEMMEFQESYNEKFLKNTNPKWRLTIVDCHI